MKREIAVEVQKFSPQRSTHESGGSSAFGNELPKKGGAWLSGEAVQSAHHRYPKGTSYGRTPPGGPKSRKLHYGELVGRKYVSPPPKHYPRGFKGIANRGPAEAQQSGFGGERRSPPRGFPPGTAERLSFCP